MMLLLQKNRGSEAKSWNAIVTTSFVSGTICCRAIMLVGNLLQSNMLWCGLVLVYVNGVLLRVGVWKD